MNKTRCQIDYEIRIHSSALFCGSGVGSVTVDRICLHDARGNLVIPGSHIKGIVRQKCEDLLSTMDVRFPDVHRSNESAQDSLLINRIFGTPGPKDITCVFSEVIMETDSFYHMARKRVRMSRRLKRPIAHALFDTEYAHSIETFPLKGEVALWVQDFDNGSSNAVPEELSLLCAGLRLVDCIGGDKSTGAGSVEFAIMKIRCGEKAFSPEAVLARFSDESWVTEGLHAYQGGE